MRKTIVSAVAVAGLTMAFTAQASNQHEIGVIGQSTEITDNLDATEFGAFYNLHTLNTVEEGYIYRANVDWTTGDEDGLDSTTYDIGFTSGYRTQISSQAYFDLLAGLGHKNWEVDASGLATGTVKTTYLRYGAALQFEANRNNTLRLEVGSRLNLDGEFEVEADNLGLGSGSTSIHNDNNFYAEASIMTESTGVPLRFSAFYENREYEVDASTFDTDAYTTGLKVSAIF